MHMCHMRRQISVCYYNHIGHWWTKLWKWCPTFCTLNCFKHHIFVRFIVFSELHIMLAGTVTCQSKTIYCALTHWGQVTHICVSKLTIIGSDNGLSPDRRQAIIWINAGILLIRTLGTNFSEILSHIDTFSFKKTLLKMSSAKWRPSMCWITLKDIR